MKKVVVLSVTVALIILTVSFSGCGGKSIYDYETVAPSNVTTAAQLVTDENGKLVETTEAEETEPEDTTGEESADEETDPE